MQQIAPARPVQAPPKKSSKKGCLFGCLGTVIGVPLILALVGYYVVMHTALPFKLVAKAIEQDSRVTIEGIGGSISKGFTIETLRTTDFSGNVSVLEGLTLMWGDINRMRKRNELVIDEIGLRRAHIFIKTDDTSSSSSSSGTSGRSSSSGTPLALFEIKKVDVRELVIESTTGDFKLELAEFLMKGLRIRGNNLELDSLSLGSNVVDLAVEDAKSAMIAGEEVPFTRRVVGALKPNLHESLSREIDFTIDFGAIDGEVVFRARALNDRIDLISLGDGRHQSLTVREFTSADYFTEDFAGPITKLSFEFEAGEPDTATGAQTGQLKSGSFTLGTTPFTIAPQTLTEDITKPDSSPLPIAGTAQVGPVEITAVINEGASPPPLVEVALSSQPERSQPDLIALLWFGKPLADLTVDEVSQVTTIAKQGFATPTK